MAGETESIHGFKVHPAASLLPNIGKRDFKDLVQDIKENGLLNPPVVAKDGRLVNAQFWYQFPIHMAVRAGHAGIVKLLLARGAEPGQSRFTYSSWGALLQGAKERGYHSIESLLQRAMQKRFNYNPQFDTLKEAIIARDFRSIDRVLRLQPCLARASDALGNNPLHWSVLTRQLGLIERFVGLGTPIDAERVDGQTPVLLAVNGATDYWYRATRPRSHPSLRNSFVLVGSLLAQGARYTISVAAAVGDQERVMELLRKEPGLARRLDSARVSPLCYAAAEGHLHIVRLLLEHGAEPNLPEESAPNGAALFNACCRNHFEVAELLLAHDADPNAGADSSGCCLTICEVCHGKQAKPLQQLLRRHGAYSPPYAMNAQELRRALRARHPVIQHDEFLGNILAKRDSRLLKLCLDGDPTMPRRLASGDYPRAPAMFRMLLARGLDPNKTDWLGRTTLHFCAANGDRAIAALLCNAGADINARDLEWKGTPLAAAVRSWCEEQNPSQAKRRRQMVEFLLKRGAATNLPDDEPWATPLAWAQKRGRADIARLLRAHGAR